MDRARECTSQCLLREAETRPRPYGVTYHKTRSVRFLPLLDGTEKTLAFGLCSLHYNNTILDNPPYGTGCAINYAATAARLRSMAMVPVLFLACSVVVVEGLCTKYCR